MLRFIPAILWAATIFAVSSQPSLPQTPFLFEGIDKLFHAVEYGVLMALILFGARWPRGRNLWWWVLPCVLYAASDEIHQALVPNRSADLLDWLADSAGLVLVTALWLRLQSGRFGRWLAPSPRAAS